METQGPNRNDERKRYVFYRVGTSGDGSIAFCCLALHCMKREVVVVGEEVVVVIVAVLVEVAPFVAVLVVVVPVRLVGEGLAVQIPASTVLLTR